MLEFVDYRRVNLEPSILVDRSRGEKLVIEMDISFPKVPCYRKLEEFLRLAQADSQYYRWT